tara:strand:- start:754 stop:2055 length:1302 start_codon:yes stop_codon:yes gene_type:complete
MLKILKSYFFSIMILMSATVSGQNLQEIYQQVLKSDPRLKIGSLTVEVYGAQEQQAFGALMPQVSINSSWTENQQVTTGSSKSSFSGERHTLSVQQSLIDMPKYYAWKRAEDKYEVTSFERKYTHSLIRLDTVERYFDLLLAMDELALIRETKTSTEKKVEHIRALYQMQRVKVTELYEVEAELDTLASQEIDAMQKKDLAKEGLSELTNKPVKDVAVLSATIEFIQRVENINEWSANALPANSSLMALQKTIDASQRYIDQQTAGHFPRLDMQLSKNKSNIGFEFAASPTTTTEVASLNIKIPLFSGGKTTAHVYEATQQLAISRAKYDLKKRELIKELKDTFLVVNAMVRRTEAADKAIKSTRKSYQAMNKSFELGIATVSEVLLAQQKYSEAKKNYQAAKYSYITTKAMLLQISGKLNDDAIYEINKWLL